MLKYTKRELYRYMPVIRTGVSTNHPKWLTTSMAGVDRFSFPAGNKEKI